MGTPRNTYQNNNNIKMLWDSYNNQGKTPAQYTTHKKPSLPNPWKNNYKTQSYDKKRHREKKHPKQKTNGKKNHHTFPLKKNDKKNNRQPPKEKKTNTWKQPVDFPLLPDSLPCPPWNKVSGAAPTKAHKGARREVKMCFSCVHSCKMLFRDVSKCVHQLAIWQLLCGFFLLAKSGQVNDLVGRRPLVCRFVISDHFLSLRVHSHCSAAGSLSYQCQRSRKVSRCSEGSSRRESAHIQI